MPYKEIRPIQTKMSVPDVPEAYVIGSIPFIHTEIYLDSKPLIPRTETEYWVDLAIKEIQNGEITAPRILDLCAGSGCIGVAVLKEIPEAFIDFAEINKNHHKTIKKNILENKLDSSRTEILGGNLFENISDSYDFILSNPPYIDSLLKHRVQRSVAEFEPEEALYGGESGLEVIMEIISKAPKYLNPGGILYIEHEPEQVEFISKQPNFIESKKDQYNVTRYSKFIA